MASIAKLPLYSGAITTTTTGDAKSLQNRAKKFIAFLNVSACHAATTVDVRLQHSPDKTNWKEIVNFTDVVGATGSEAIYEGSFTGAGCVFPNIRAVVNLSGATQSATVDVSIWFDDDK